VTAKRATPGLAKTRGLALLSSRSVELWLSSDYKWRELFETADVMSEGAVRAEPDVSTYYGTTSILMTAAHLGTSDRKHLRQIAQFAGADPHARLRAVRVACLEAQLRAGAPLGRVRAELTVRLEKRGLRIDVEVEAPLIAEKRRASPSLASAKPRKRRRASANG
jgi:hypothetical protein